MLAISAPRCTICDDFGLVFSRSKCGRAFPDIWYWTSWRCTCNASSGIGDVKVGDEIERKPRYWDNHIKTFLEGGLTVDHVYSDKARAQFDIDQKAAEDERKALQEVGI